MSKNDRMGDGTSPRSALRTDASEARNDASDVALEDALTKVASFALLARSIAERGGDEAERERCDSLVELATGAAPCADAERFDRAGALAELREAYGERFADDLEERSDAYIGGALESVRARPAPAAAARTDAAPEPATTAMAARDAMVLRNRTAAIPPPPPIDGLTDQQAMTHRLRTQWQGKP